MDYQETPASIAQMSRALRQKAQESRQKAHRTRQSTLRLRKEIEEHLHASELLRFQVNCQCMALADGRSITEVTRENSGTLKDPRRSSVLASVPPSGPQKSRSDTEDKTERH